MVVLNIYGKIPRTCISQRLGLYISNLPDDWRESLEKELKLSVQANGIYQQRLGTNHPCGIQRLYKKVFPDKELPQDFEGKHFRELAENMIGVFVDYDYADMPLGGWETNCFDGRLCEEDYGEKLIDFLNYLSRGREEYAPVVQWTYSSNHDGAIDHYRIFWGGESPDLYIAGLKKWGEALDLFLREKKDYLLFDYLISAIYRDNEYNEYHMLKAYSLCQLFLEKERESELDDKLIEFMDDCYTAEEKKECTQLLRKMRNKVAHGDFLAFENLVEEYAQKILDGRFAFDYSELSRKNWVIQNVCCLLDDIVRKLIQKRGL